MCSGELYIRLTERQRNAEGPGVSSLVTSETQKYLGSMKPFSGSVSQDP